MGVTAKTQRPDNHTRNGWMKEQVLHTEYPQKANSRTHATEPKTELPKFVKKEWEREKVRLKGLRHVNYD